MPSNRTIQRPLLPYEKQLIDLLGCSVEEYQFFVKEAEKRSGVRPAEYDLVPDVRNEASLIVAIVSLVLGVASTVLSLVLTPKPRMPAQGGGGGNRILDSRNGVDRFAQTSGFDSLVELAQYGDAVPIVWTKYDPVQGTGGVLITPRLVWSRMLSLSSHQGVKMLFVVGESGIQPPDLAGVYLGNNALDALGQSSYALWWNNNGKPTRANLLYGTQSGPATGDPQTNPEIFTTGLGPTGFSQALTPANNTQFGISNPIPNGTQYRSNYKVVSAPKDSSGRGVLIRDRMKVAGFVGPIGSPIATNNGGTGYSFFRRQGIIGYSSKSTINVSVGSTVQFILSQNELGDNFFGGSSSPDNGGGSVDDINNALNSECAAADDVLQLGETIVINNSIWRVVNRALPVWTPGTTQIVTLQCIEVLESNEVRVLGDQYITTAEGNVNLHYGAPDERFKSAGPQFDNLARIAIGTVKNTRPCQITHIGFRSQVWGRFNGLCNFNSLPTGTQVRIWDDDNVSVQSGTMSEYFMRTSCFTLHYREIGAPNWIYTGLRFCVRGASPTDQFHQITINHGSKRALEFRIVPMPASFLQRLQDTGTLYWLTNTPTASTLTTAGISVFAFVQEITVAECKRLDQMICSSNPADIRIFEDSTGVSEVSHYGSLITRSCDGGPEHQIVYINEMVEPDSVPTYSNLTTAGISIRSNRNVTSLDQLRFWISSGVNNSNSFPELVRYLLSRASSIDSRIVDTASFTTASNFCASRGLFFDGVISESANLRDYITSLAPFFLLNFVIANGKFSLMPALPEGLPNVTNLFTAGNIVEGSFNLTYLPLDQRRDFQAVMVYRRHTTKNELPVLESIRVRFADTPTTAPIETFDMSAYCTRKDHALQVARYFLSIRRRVTHGITFKAVPDNAAGIAPGNYIKVAVEQNVINSTGNGVISATGQITSVTPLANGSYPIVYYRSGDPDVSTGTLTVNNGFTADTQLFGALFSQQSSSITAATYLIEQVELDDDGLVTVTATEFPASALQSDMSGAGMIVEGETAA